MLISSHVCCDPNLVVRLVTKIDDTAVCTLWQQWRRDGRPIVAPRLLRYEDEQIYNAVRHQPSRVRLVGGSA